MNPTIQEAPEPREPPPRVNWDALDEFVRVNLPAAEPAPDEAAPVVTPPDVPVPANA